MDGKIQLRLTDAALHEFDVFADVLWGFSTILAADERLVAPILHQM